jgi:hypothetical protein
MPEWSTYSLSDFLMFSSSVYFRLFELENRRIWPLQVAAVLAGTATIAMICRATGQSRRGAIVVLACAWLACAWAYFRQSYSTIHTFGNTFAAVFVVEAAGLLLQAAVGPKSAATVSRPNVERAGLVLLAFAVFLQPLASVALGRPFAQTEWFAFMPDPTVLATIGALTAIPKTSTWLFAIPLIWSLYSGLTLYTMQSGAALVPFLQAVLACAFSILRWRERRSREGRHR